MKIWRKGSGLHLIWTQITCMHDFEHALDVGLGMLRCAKCTVVGYCADTEEYHRTITNPDNGR